MLVPNKPVKWRINDREYMKVIYLNGGTRRKYERANKPTESWSLCWLKEIFAVMNTT